MASAGIRELKDNLSHYVRRIEAGERIAVTAHGRVVAELSPPSSPGASRRLPYDDLVAAGVVRLPIETGNPLADWPKLRLPAGTAAQWIEEDRGKP
jgi:prevent-host-death family protein